jgi:hypothetical protein
VRAPDLSGEEQRLDWRDSRPHRSFMDDEARAGLGGVKWLVHPNAWPHPPSGCLSSTGWNQRPVLGAGLVASIRACPICSCSLEASLSVRLVLRAAAAATPPP